MKASGERPAMLTAYDYPMARLFDEAGADLLLVGDSLGMVVLGFPDTTEVTLDHIAHHTAAVARGARRAPVVADLPIATYETPTMALQAARRLLGVGAGAVKLEGGRTRLPQIEALASEGIPVMGHIGMLPQRVRIEGGYRVKGKTPEDAAALEADAAAVENAGAFAMVLELVVPEVAARITRASRIPTIGIGSGGATDGQVLVAHDLVGMFPWFTPKFAKRYADVAAAMSAAARRFVEDVKAGR